MAAQREHLPTGSRVRFQSGNEYEITGAPIGSGGGGIIYPAVRLLRTESGWERDGIGYALKECFPAAAQHHFYRSESGEILPEEPSEEEERYLRRVQQMQLGERATSQQIYRSGSRLVPILEASEKVMLALPGQPYASVRNVFTAMESLAGKGQSLSGYLKRYRRMTPSQTFHIAQQLLLAVREIHRAGYLHLDIQAGNVFVKGSLEDKSDIVTMIDFGAARRLCQGRTEPITDRVVFTTQGFSAPELLLRNDGTLQLGPEADIYSVGCLILYLLTGSRYDTGALLHNTTGKYLTRFKLRGIDCPKHLVDRMQAIIAHALEPDERDRYHSADEMLDDVSDFLRALEPYRSDLSQVPYDAFICYKHGPADSMAARLLQQQLEHFRAPRGTAKKRRPFSRVFVDEGELSSCADFGSQIRAALKNAGWLIVICSPETKSSPWVLSEIDTFLEYHDHSRVLALITAGEPAGVFPPQLLGSGEGSAQALAADARGKNIREMRRKLRGDALLKLAAPMLGTTFDTLKQRNRIYALQRVAVLTALGLAGSLAFAGYAVRQNRQINAAYQSALVSQSQRLAALAREQYDAGNPIEAVELALSTLPAEGQDRPVIAGAEYVLSKALNAYTPPSGPGREITASGAYQHAREIQDLLADFGAGTLFTRDSNNIYVWSIEACSLLDTITLDSRISVFHEKLLNKEKKLLLFSDHDQLYCYDYSAMEMRWSFDADRVMGALTDGDTAFIVSETDVIALDVLTGAEEYTISLALNEDEYLPCDDIAISEDGSVLAFNIPVYEFDKEYDETDDPVILANLTERTVRLLRQGAGRIERLRFTPEGELLVVSSRSLASQIIYSGHDRYEQRQNNTLTVASYRPESDSPVWERSFSFGAFSLTPRLELLPDTSAALSYGDNAVRLGLADGEVLNTWELTSPVMRFWTTSLDDRFYALTANGSIQCLLLNDSHWYETDYYMGDISAVAMDPARGILLTLPQVNSHSINDTVTKYEYFLCDRNWVSISDDTDMSDLTYSYFSPDGLSAFWDDGTESVFLCDAADGAWRTVPLAFDDSHDVSVNGIVGTSDIGGDRTLLLAAADNSAPCVICIDLRSLEPRILDVPLPEESSTGPIQADGDAAPAEDGTWSLLPWFAALAYEEDTVYFVCETTAAGQGGACPSLFVYAWRIGEDTVREIASYSEEQADQGSRYTVERILVGPQSKKLLLVAGSTSLDEERRFRVLTVDVEGKTVRQVLDGAASDVLFASEYIHLNADGTLFSFVSDREVSVYDTKGALVCSVPYDPAVETVTDVIFLPEDDAFLILKITGMLTKHALDGGAVLSQQDLGREDLLHSSYRLSWTLLEDGTLILGDSLSTAVIDTGDTTWGLLAGMPHATAYDGYADRFYLLDSETSDGTSLGYFQRYSTQDLIDMGRRFLGGE